MKLWHIKFNYSWKHYTMFLSEVNYRNKLDQNQTMRFKILKKWKAASFPKNILSILELKELLSLLAKKVYCIKENLSMRFIQNKMFQSFIPSSEKRKGSLLSLLSLNTVLRTTASPKRGRKTENKSHPHWKQCITVLIVSECDSHHGLLKCY